MPVFKAFFAIAKKRRNAALIYLGVYAVITLLLSALSQDSINENFKASQRSIAITDEDNTDASRALCDYLASIHQVTTPEPGEDTALLDAIYYRTLNYAMVIPEGFEDRVLAGETKDLVSSLTIPGSSSSQYVDNQITQYVQALQLYLAGGDTIAEAIDHTDHTNSEYLSGNPVRRHGSDSGYLKQPRHESPDGVLRSSRKNTYSCHGIRLSPVQSRHLAALSAAWSRILPESHAAALCRLCHLEQPCLSAFYDCTLPAHLDVLAG